MDKKMDNLEHLKKLQERLKIKIMNADRTSRQKFKKFRDNLISGILFFALTLISGYITFICNANSNLVILLSLIDVSYLVINISLFVDYKKDKNFYKKYLQMQEIINNDIDILENSLGLNSMKDFDIKEIENYNYSFDPMHKLGIYEDQKEQKNGKMYKKKK